MTVSILAGCDKQPDEQISAEIAVTAEPGPKIVGHQKCAECHSDIATRHAQSPHAHTFARTKDSQIAKELCGRTIAVDAPYDGYTYVCDDQGLTAEMPDRFPGRLFPLDFAVGSGKHAVTFFTLLPDPNRTTIGVEHRMSWYAHGEDLDVTPGQDGLSPRNNAEFFGKVFEGEPMERCIDCHTTTATIVGKEVHDLYAGVYCEECHGPGSDHVTASQKGLENVAATIESGWNALEEIQLCGRCHRMPDEIEADRLKRYPNSLVRFQPVGLLQSPCFLQSNGELRCTTCHDPHGPVEADSVNQIANCLTCHSAPQQVHCSRIPKNSDPVAELRKNSEQPNCIQCHMPAIELLPNISFHDHWIRVRSPDGKTEIDDDASHAVEK